MSTPATPAAASLAKSISIKSPLNRKTDVFDTDDFDSVKFINQIYPDEASLGDLDKFVDMLRKQIKAVDKDIFSAVRTQSGTQARSRQDLTVATSQIGELFGRIHEIQSKAADTEALVQEICRDIRKLDYAKRHLTHTITSLRRLAMLTAAVDDLEQEAVLDDFKLLLGTNDTKPSLENVERLGAACAVVNALGPKVRDQVMDWLCEREMTVYQTIFSMSGDAAKLDRFERRFAWFKGRLEERKEVWEVFPAAWRVPQTLTLTFCKITKAALKRLLSDSDDVIKADVAPLIKTVVATNKFEREMAARFGGGSLDDEDEGMQEIDNLPASEARRRLEAYRKRQQAAAAAKAKAEAGGGGGEEAAAAAVRGAFEGAISAAFEGALKHYVAEEQKELMAVLEGLLKEEGERRWQPPEEEAASSRVLGSANQLFLKIRGSLTRCVKMVSRGPTLLGVAGVFRRVLGAYANELLKRLPRTADGRTTAAPPFVGSDWYIRMSEEEEGVVANILATAEYCRETMEGLATAVSKELPRDLAPQVDFSGEEAAFSNVVSQAVSVLVLGVNTRLDGALQDMLRMRWDTLEHPGDDSGFVGSARRVLGEAAPRLGPAMDKYQFSFFCDKMARMFVPRYMDTMYRLRKLSDKGTLQLSIDTDSIRRALLEFPKAGRPLDEEGDTAAYTHYVEREMGAAINLVKVLQAKPENLVDTFILLMPEAAKTGGDLARICELQGYTKKLQSELLAQFQRKRGGGDPFSAAHIPSAGGLPGAASAPPGGSGVSSVSSSSYEAGREGFPGAANTGGMLGGGNLDALKLSVNTFTRELASSMKMVGPRGGGGTSQDNSPMAGRDAKSQPFKVGGLNFNMQQTAARTREGLAKMAGILPGKLQGLGGGNSDGR